ncbi:MAG TPA: GAF domain-containing protein [Polyangiaceae bacterium]
MRWFVEVASIGQAEASEQWVVEAAQWQPALQAARSLRGEASEMSGFSVELLEDGFRAIDPATFVRYIVRRAPDGTPLSRPESKASHGHGLNGGNGGRVSSKPPSDGLVSARPAPSAPDASMSKADRIAAMLDLGAAGARPAPKPPTGHIVSTKSSPAASAVQAPRPVHAPRPASQPPRPASQPPAAPGFAPIQPVEARPPSHEPLPLAELLFQREEEPTTASPLTYREAAWVVAEGTSVDAAVRLLVGMFEGVRAALANAKPGKLVNMAIFDHRFQGRPVRPPLATLTWKDWKDKGQGPDIRRRGEPPASLAPGIEPQGVPASQTPTAPEIPAAPPLPTIASAPPIVVAPPLAAPSPVIADPFPPAAPPSHVAPPEPIVAPPMAPPQAAPPVHAPAAAKPPVASQAPEMVVELSASEVPPAPAPQPVAAPPPRVPSSPRIRLSGVELITDLFEAMHDLHFLHDALEGADFVLALIMDKLPSLVGLVHFYDINAREFVVVRAVGPGASKVLQIRTNEKDALIAEAMHKRRAVVIENATDDPRAHNGRWALIETSCHSLVCAPVEQGGRFLGLLEVANPRNGGPFQEGDGHALTYIGEQFAEFLATRGLVLGDRGSRPD